MSHEHSHNNECCQASTTAAQTFDDMDFERGIWNAALYNDMPRLKKLLEHCSPDVEDRAGYTALHYASRNGHMNICAELLKKGAKVDAKTRAGGATALQRAVTAGHTDIVKLLVENGADVSIKDNDGNNALHRAVAVDSPDLIRVLLQTKPDLKNIRNGKGQLPIEITTSDYLHNLLLKD